jgi:hypothetical protein
MQVPNCPEYTFRRVFRVFTKRCTTQLGDEKMKATSAILMSFGLSLLTACATNEAPTTVGPTVSLTGEQLRTLGAGKTFEGKTSDGAHIRVYHAPDGKISASSRSGSKTYTNNGTREIKDNAVCNFWNSPDWKNGCWTGTQRGDMYYFKPTTSGLPSSEGKYLDGNPYNL